MYRIIFSVLTSVALIGCGNDDGGPVPDDGACPPEASTFTGIHAVLSSSRCAAAGCHVGVNAPTSGNLDLSGTEAEVYDRLVGVATNDQEGAVSYPLRVEASSPETSYLLHMVEAPMPVGSSLGRMPPGGSLSACEIEGIRDWIASGAAP